MKKFSSANLDLCKCSPLASFLFSRSDTSQNVLFPPRFAECASVELRSECTFQSWNGAKVNARDRSMRLTKSDIRGMKKVAPQTLR